MNSLKILDGLRVLSCCLIVFVHMHLLVGAFHYPSSSVKHVVETPILRHFIGGSIVSVGAVNLFWMLSGFLCVHQLNKLIMKDTSNGSQMSKYWYIWFFVNRILRLYPVFVLIMIATYVNSTFETMPGCSNTTDILMGLSSVDVFFKHWDAVGCSGSGWTLCADIHGYIVIILLFKLFGKDHKPKKYILGIIILFSIIGDVYIAFKENLHHSIHQPDITTWPRKQSPFPTTWDYYDLQLESGKYDESFLQNEIEMKYSRTFFDSLYYTSIFSNGSSIFVGALLYLNIISQKHEKYSMDMALGFIPTLFITVCILVSGYLLSLTIFRTDDITWIPKDELDIKTALDTLLNGLALHINDFMFYCIVYLLMTPNSTMVVRIMQNVCQWKVFQFVSKFTYGIYMTHIAVGVGFGMSIDYVNTMLSDPSKYNWNFLIKNSIYVFCISLIVAIILYIVIEYPIKLLRYKYIRSLYLCQSTKATKKLNKDE